MLPSILDEDSLSAVCTLESAELAFARRQGRSRNQYLHALYLKAMASLGHSHFQPKDLPRQFRQRIAEQLDLEADLGRLLSIERREKSRIVTTVRAFLGLAALSRYMRRRYMPTASLMEAATILAHGYQQTAMAERLGDMNVLLTDSMQVRTLKQSLIARQHHRYLSGKSSLLYQHITSNCICLFTQALLCNVSEAIHMLVGAMACRTGNDPLINICDSAGKSNLVFGLSGLLNILLYPRVRSRHLKLWVTEKRPDTKISPPPLPVRSVASASTRDGRISCGF